MTKTAKQKTLSPRKLLDEVFVDTENLARALGWEQEFRQLEPGKLEAGVRVVGHELCQAVRITFNRSFHQLAKPPSAYMAFGLPDEETVKLRCAGKDLRAGSVVNFNVPSGLDMTNQGPLNGSILVFEKQHFMRILDLLDLEESMLTEFVREPYWIPEPRQRNGLLGLLTAVFEAAQDKDELALREYRDSFDFEIAVGILQIISGSRLPEPPPLPSRLKTLKRVLKLLESDTSNLITVAELCRVAGASYSTLVRAFMEEFGVPPKVYIRARRLAVVQKELTRPERSGTITEIAHEWGFWHMSAFARDYRKQFGELPSETLSRKKF